MTNYPWLTEARRHLGLREITGKEHNPTIVNWLLSLKAWWRDDETPWCGTFVAASLRAAGLPVPKAWFRARAYERYGTPLLVPCVGCIAVFTRQGGGHVAFVVGHDTRGRLMCLGGNQGNAVTIAPFDRARVTAYRWPSPDFPFRTGLPVLVGGNEKSSEDEA